MAHIRHIACGILLVALGGAAGVALAQAPGYWQAGPGYPAYGPGMGRAMMGWHRGGASYPPGPYAMHRREMMERYGPGRYYGPGPRMGRWPGPYGASEFGPQRFARYGGRAMHERGGRRMRGHWRHLARVLRLSEAQRAKARRIMEDTRRKNWDVVGQIQTERFKLREMMRADKVDPDAAVAQKRKIDDLRLQVMKARLQARNQVLALLTPEQRAKARAFGPMHWYHRRGGLGRFGG